MRNGISVGGSWPPERPPGTWLADPYGTPPSGPGDRLPGEEACEMAWTWSPLTGQCEPPPHEPCASPAYCSWDRFKMCLWDSQADCAGGPTGIDENGRPIRVDGMEPSEEGTETSP